jgi:hypothetical protein
MAGFRQLSLALGHLAATRLVDEFQNAYPTATPEILGAALCKEAALLTRRIAHFNRLLGKGQYPRIGEKIRAVQSANIVKIAADWITAASTSSNGGDSARIQYILATSLASNCKLTNMATLVQLNRMLAPNARQKPRPIDISGSPLPSSTAGFALFERELSRLALYEQRAGFAKYLFGHILGYHPFIDGNGRTARAVYAIATIRLDDFHPLSVEEESELSGLGLAGPAGAAQRI